MGHFSDRLHGRLLRLVGGALRPVHYRGFARAADEIKRHFPPGDPVKITLPTGGTLSFNLHDTYWSRLLAPGFSYEPELGAVIKTLMTNPDCQFLDLGANIGYWSVFANAITPGRVTAVEASPPMHAKLLRNAAMNEGIKVLPPTAVWHLSGETVEIVTHPDRHAGASITNRGHRTAREGYQRYTVPTRTIDDIAGERPSGPLLVKLDVEGVEMAAIDGATQTLASRDVVILYEDHGNDLSSNVTAHLLSSNFLVAALADDGQMTPILSAAAATSVKRDRSKGYNFIAYREGSQLAGMAGAPDQ